MHNIYKDRCRKFYDHTIFENNDCSQFYYNEKGQKIPGEPVSECFKFSALNDEYQETLNRI